MAAAVDAAPPGIDAGTGPGPLAIIDVFHATDLTPDGHVALLEQPGSAQVDVYLYDTLTGQLDLKTTSGDPNHDFATGISANLRVSANHGVPVQAGLWDEAGGWLDITNPNATGCDLDVGSAWDVDAAGHTTVGLMWDGCTTNAFRWTDASGTGVYTALERLGVSQDMMSPPSNRATVISDDGKIAAGWAQIALADRSAAYWDESGAGHFLNPADQETPSEVMAISADGAFMAGIAGSDAFTYTAAAGLQLLPRTLATDPLDHVIANAVGAGGQLVFGTVSPFFGGSSTAWVWTSAGGMKNLRDVATAAGIDVPANINFTNVLAASTDGTVILGTVDELQADPNAFPLTKSFVLRLPVTAYGL